MPHLLDDAVSAAAKLTQLHQARRVHRVLALVVKPQMLRVLPVLSVADVLELKVILQVDSRRWS